VDPTWPNGQFLWKAHLTTLAEHGLVVRNYPENTMVPGEGKPDNQRQKGIADMGKAERENVLSALHAPGRMASKHKMVIERVDDDHKKSKYSDS